MANIYGYVRVSTKEQNVDRQMIALKQLQIDFCKIYIDKMSGKDFDRPQYKRLLKRLKPDDVVYIKSIDRLGRNYYEIMEQWRIITKEKRADICVLDLPLLDTRRDKNLLGTFISDLVLALLSYVSENERVNIRQRQAEGIAAAMQRGVRFGRPRTLLPNNFKEAYYCWRSGELSVKKSAELCGMPATTFYEKAKIVRHREEVMKSAGYKGTLTGDDEDVAAGAEALDSETAIR